MIFDAAQRAQSTYLNGEEFHICMDAMIVVPDAERLFRTDVQNGLKSREFLLYLQPYVDHGVGNIVGGEVLSRWEHPGRGLLLLGDFLPFMEREHLTPQLDYLCMENACEYLETVSKSDESDFLSPAIFHRKFFFSGFCEKLQGSDRAISFSAGATFA